MSDPKNPLKDALSELATADAKGVPEESTIAAAPEGTTWSGKKENGEDWTLLKHNEGSYHCNC